MEKSRLLKLLKTYAFQKKLVTLASGAQSSYYLDCKQVMLRGDAQHDLGKLFYNLMREQEQNVGEKFAACGGMALGAVPLACALSMTAFLHHRQLPSLIVRKQAKAHGTTATLEGMSQIPRRARVLLLEDVVTTGGSTIKAAQTMRQHGFNVDTVLAIVDRDAGGSDNLAKHNLTLSSLFSSRDFLEDSHG